MKRKCLTVGIILLFIGVAVAPSINSNIVGELTGGITKNPLDGPVGPTEGYVGVEYTFCFQLPVNPNGDEYYTKWDWGDGNITDWLGPYPSGQVTCASHTWWTLGSYGIRVKLKDTNGTETLWSDTLIITIIDNLPPNLPNITGPHYGKTNTIYTFSMGSTSDPNADPFYCLWDWGDGNFSDWIGPINHNASHAWNEPGHYTIRVKVKDIWGGSYSSEPFTIYITSKSILLGLIQGVNKSENVTILNMTLGVIIIFHPLMINVFSSVRILILNDDSWGLIRSRVIVGRYYALILSNLP
jgi:hypothetical protein